MKINIKDLDTVYRIMEDVGYGVVLIEDDKLQLFGGGCTLKPCEDGTWCVKIKHYKEKYFPNLYQATESAMINQFMGKLAVAIYTVKDYDENLVDLSD